MRNGCIEAAVRERVGWTQTEHSSEGTNRSSDATATRRSSV